MTKPVLAITMGDAAGIGAEITVKALMKPEIYTQTAPQLLTRSSFVRLRWSCM